MYAAAINCEIEELSRRFITKELQRVPNERSQNKSISALITSSVAANNLSRFEHSS